MYLISGCTKKLCRCVTARKQWDYCLHALLAASVQPLKTKLPWQKGSSHPPFVFVSPARALEAGRAEGRVVRALPMLCAHQGKLETGPGCSCRKQAEWHWELCVQSQLQIEEVVRSSVWTWKMKSWSHYNPPKVECTVVIHRCWSHR